MGPAWGHPGSPAHQTRPRPRLTITSWVRRPSKRLKPYSGQKRFSSVAQTPSSSRPDLNALLEPREPAVSGIAVPLASPHIGNPDGLRAHSQGFLLQVETVSWCGCPFPPRHRGGGAKRQLPPSGSPVGRAGSTRGSPPGHRSAHGINSPLSQPGRWASFPDPQSRTPAGSRPRTPKTCRKIPDSLSFAGKSLK